MNKQQENFLVSKINAADFLIKNDSILCNSDCENCEFDDMNRCTLDVTEEREFVLTFFPEQLV